jgi:hypothetical protein
MPALLIRDGDLPVETMMPALGTISCKRDGCTCSYTFRSNDPIFMIGKERNTDVMGRMAIEKVKQGHSIHATKTYYWKGPELGWLEADTEAQRKAL